MNKILAWIIKLTLGVELGCDICHRIFMTEKGKNIHRASHKKGSK